MTELFPGGLSGVDPYDALRGTRVPRWVHGTFRSRQALTQLRKLSPVDLSGLLGIKPYTMAKTVGCALSALARMHAAGREGLEQVAESLIATLSDSPAGTLGGGWGYEFDVQTRWAFYPRNSPNIIATVFVARGLLECALAFGRSDWMEYATGGARFIAETFRSEESQLPHYRYTEDTDRVVHNANLLGAALVCATASLTGDHPSVRSALVATRLTLDAQHEDGSWSYGEGQGLGWADNFHTAYNLDSLLLIALATRDSAVEASLRDGLRFWTQRFFDADGAPRYTPDKRYPVDIHCAATALDVASRCALLGYLPRESVRPVALWTAEHLVTPRGTRFRRYRFFTDSRHFVRWGDAHMALAISSMACLDASQVPPLEKALDRIGAAA